jgi:hypothetical protein
MSDDESADAIFVGGPNDSAIFTSDVVAVVEVPLDGLIHRYVRTTARRDGDGVARVVYNYDGVVDPAGAMPGIQPDRTGDRHER